MIYRPAGERGKIKTISEAKLARNKAAKKSFDLNAVILRVTAFFFVYHSNRVLETKKLFWAALAMILFVGCKYDDSEIWGEIGQLREEVNQNSEDIATLSALIEALNRGKVIVSTEQIAE